MPRKSKSTIIEELKSDIETQKETINSYQREVEYYQDHTNKLRADSNYTQSQLQLQLDRANARIDALLASAVVVNINYQHLASRIYEKGIQRNSPIESYDKGSDMAFQFDEDQMKWDRVGLAACNAKQGDIVAEKCSVKIGPIKVKK